MTPKPFEALSHYLLVLSRLVSRQKVSQLFPPHPLACFILNEQLSMYSTCLESPFCPHSLYIFHILSQTAKLCSSYPQVFVVVVASWLVVKEQFWLDGAGLSPLVERQNQELLYSSWCRWSKWARSGGKPRVQPEVFPGIEYLRSSCERWPLDSDYFGLRLMMGCPSQR